MSLLVYTASLEEIGTVLIMNFVTGKNLDVLIIGKEKIIGKERQLARFVYNHYGKVYILISYAVMVVL